MNQASFAVECDVLMKEEKLRKPIIYTTETLTIDSLKEHQQFVYGEDVYQRIMHFNAIKIFLTIMGILLFLSGSGFVLFHLLGGIAYGIIILGIVSVVLALSFEQRSYRYRLTALRELVSKRRQIKKTYRDRGNQIIDILPSLLYFFYFDEVEKEFGVIFRDTIVFRCPFEFYKGYELYSGGGMKCSQKKKYLSHPEDNFIVKITGGSSVMNPYFDIPEPNVGETIFNLRILLKGDEPKQYDMKFFSYFDGLGAHFKDAMHYNRILNYVALDRIIKVLEQCKEGVE